MNLNWKSIWKEFNKWCESQEKYPWEWFQQEPQLQKIIKAHKPTKVKTQWKRVWKEYEDKWEHSEHFASWKTQKRWIKQLVEKYSK